MSIASATRRFRERLKPFTGQASPGLLTTGLYTVLLLFAVYFLGCFVYVAVSTLNYPFNLEWMEGQTVDIIQRIRDGLPVYTKPSLEYVPYIYTPYYFYVSALVSFFTGVGFFPARLVSMLSAIGSGWIIYLWIRREGGRWWHGAIAAGLFFATYRLSGRWFDIGRIDSFYMFLMAAGLYMLCYHRQRGSAITTAVVLAAAFFTKQSALMTVLPALLAMLYIDPRHGRRVLAFTLGLIALGIVYFHFITNGWFEFYVFKIAAGHTMDRRWIRNFWRIDLYPCLIMALLSFIGWCFLWKRDGHKKALLFMMVCAGLIGSSYVSRVHSLSHVNVLIPAFFALALMTGVALVHIRQFRLQRVAKVIMLALLIVQFSKLKYNVERFIPDEAAVRLGHQFFKKLEAIEGDILTAELQHVHARLGKPKYTFGMAGMDILRSDLGAYKSVKQEYRKEIVDAVRSQKFSAVLTGVFLHIPQLTKYYRKERTLSHPREYIPGVVSISKIDVWVPLERPLTNTGQPAPSGVLAPVNTMSPHEDK